MPVSTNLKIACIVADISPNQLGGAETHFFEVAKRLASEHQLLIFTGPDPSIGRFFPPPTRVVPLYYPKITNFYGMSFILFGFLPALRQLKLFQPDIIWAKQSYPQAPLAALLKKFTHAPLYITAQNPLLHQEELVIQGPAAKFASLATRLLTPLISWAYSQADLVGAVSHYSAQLARKFHPAKIVTIPNGVDLHRFNLNQKKYQTWTIITTSALIPRNGIDILINAVSQLPFSDWQLLIAGDGPQRTRLKKLAKQKKIASRVKFLGRVSNPQIPRLLAKSHLFVRPSRHEGFGVSFLEAMAAKIPIIATPVGGIPDFVVHRQTGLLAQPENPNSVARHITTLYQDRQLYRQLVHNAYNLVKTNYSWEKISASIETNFFNLIQ